MPQKKKPTGVSEQQDATREARFYASLAKIKAGTSRKQAILQSGMDPRTFNKLLRERDGEKFLTRSGKRGQYQIGALPGSVSRWDILDDAGYLHREYFDKKYSTVMGRYWNTIHNYLETGDASTLAAFKPTTVYTVDGKSYKLELSGSAIREWWSSLPDNHWNNTNKLYVKEATYA